MTEESNEHRFLWRIENFSAYPTYQLKSPIVSAKSLLDSKWFITWKEDLNFVNISFCRVQKDNGPQKLELQLELSLIDVFGNKHFEQFYDFTSLPNRSCKFSSFLRTDIYNNKDTLLPFDILTLQIVACKCDNNFLIGTKSVISTTMKVEELTFFWTIGSLTPSASNRVVHIDSRVFREGLRLTCERGTIDEQNAFRNENMFRLAIKPTAFFKVRTFMSAKIEVLDIRLNAHIKVEETHVFEGSSKDEWILPSFDISDVRTNFPEGGQLGLVCSFSISDGSHEERIESLIPLAEYMKEGSLLDDIESVFYESIIKANADIGLCIEKRLKHTMAHKVILSARSSVFREALTIFEEMKWTDSKEPNLKVSKNLHNATCLKHKSITLYVRNGKDYAHLSNVSPHVFEKMLLCMYTDSLTFDGIDDAMNLYSVGVQFDFIYLKTACEHYLISNISLKRVLSMFAFAISAKAARLESECMSLISAHRDAALASSEWDNFLQHHKNQAQKILNLKR